VQPPPPTTQTHTQPSIWGLPAVLLTIEYACRVGVGQWLAPRGFHQQTWSQQVATQSYKQQMVSSHVDCRRCSGCPKCLVGVFCTGERAGPHSVTLGTLQETSTCQRGGWSCRVDDKLWLKDVAERSACDDVCVCVSTSQVRHTASSCKVRELRRMHTAAPRAPHDHPPLTVFPTLTMTAVTTAGTTCPPEHNTMATRNAAGCTFQAFGGVTSMQTCQVGAASRPLTLCR
jgi:hypothetical protein